MKKNMSNLDRNLRFVLAAVLFAQFFILEGNMRYIAVAGLVPLATGLSGFCLLYTLFGISTCKVSDSGDAGTSSPEA